MYHTSAKLTFGGGEKNIWGYKKLQGAPKSFRGRQKAYKKNRKYSGDLFFFFLSFFFFFKKTVKNLYFVGAPIISAGGRRMVNMVNVTPLPGTKITRLKYFMKLLINYPIINTYNIL